MKRIRSMLCPLLLAAALFALAILGVSIPAIAYFDFLWDVILGILLGGAMNLFPALCGIPAKKNALTCNYWLCFFILLVILGCQYLSLAMRVHIPFLGVLANPSTRLRIVEGTFLGYCAFAASRGKH